MRSHYMKADMRFGWKPVYEQKNSRAHVALNLKIPPRVNESNIIFNGFRPQNSLQLIDRLQKQINLPNSFMPTTEFDQINYSEEWKFDSQFESGNLDQVQQVGQYEFNLFLRPDYNTQGYCNWFYFQINRSSQIPCQIRLNIMNMYKKKHLFQHDAKPLLSFKRNEWKTDQVSDVRYGENTKPKQYCLRFTINFKGHQKQVYVAASNPYTYSDLTNFLVQNNLCNSNNLLTQSLVGLPVPLLSFGQGKNYIVIVGRVHPGETNSSWVIQGIVTALLGRDNLQIMQFLQEFTVKIVPMINVDGVVSGNYRCGYVGKDLNRLYECKLDELLLPEIVAIKNLLIGIKKNLVAFIDVHQHSLKRGSFLYGPFHNVSTLKYQNVRMFPKMLEQKIRDMFRFQSCRFNKAEHYKENCARFWTERELGVTYSYCLECSQQGFYTSKFQQGKRSIVEFTPTNLQELGKNTIETLLEVCLQISKKKITAKKKKRKIIKIDEIIDVDKGSSDSDNSSGSESDDQEYNIQEQNELQLNMLKMLDPQKYQSTRLKSQLIKQNESPQIKSETNLIQKIQGSTTSRLKSQLFKNRPQANKLDPIQFKVVEHGNGIIIGTLRQRDKPELIYQSQASLKKNQASVPNIVEDVYKLFKRPYVAQSQLKRNQSQDQCRKIYLVSQL